VELPADRVPLAIRRESENARYWSDRSPREP
jgi:hypothetical protein